MRLIPNSGELDNFGRPAVESEIHSAKAHRCVDKVRAKGHPESNSWAICTASIGKSKVYAKGHGGKASPKRKIHEALDAARDAVIEEANSCHNPSGAGGGQFCAGSKRSDHPGRTISDVHPAMKGLVARKEAQVRSGTSGRAFRVNEDDSIHVDGTNYPVKRLAPYATPYYYSPAHGSVNHFDTLRKLGNHIRRAEAKKARTRTAR